MAKITETKSEPTFNITAVLKLTVGKDVKAKTMEDALVIANGLKEQDFISFGANDFVDSEGIKIVGIYKN